MGKDSQDSLLSESATISPIPLLRDRRESDKEGKSSEKMRCHPRGIDLSAENTERFGLAVVQAQRKMREFGRRQTH